MSLCPYLLKNQPFINDDYLNGTFESNADVSIYLLVKFLYSNKFTDFLYNILSIAVNYCVSNLTIKQSNDWIHKLCCTQIQRSNSTLDENAPFELMNIGSVRVSHRWV